MSQIARNYLATRKAHKEATAEFEFHLKQQHGPYLPIQKALELPFNEATQSAYDEMCKAGEEAHKARGIAFENGGDFALPIGEKE